MRTVNHKIFRIYVLEVKPAQKVIHRIIKENPPFANHQILPLLLYKGCFILQDHSPRLILGLFPSKPLDQGMD